MPPLLVKDIDSEHLFDAAKKPEMLSFSKCVFLRSRKLFLGLFRICHIVRRKASESGVGMHVLAALRKCLPRRMTYCQLLLPDHWRNNNCAFMVGHGISFFCFNDFIFEV